MLENYNKYKLLKIFLDNPTESFRLRELARMSNISPPSVMNYLKQLERENFLKKHEKRGIPFYRALRDSKEFIAIKKTSILYELYFSGIVDFLWDELSPDAIILYGSHVKGESVENSDIDLYIIGREKRINIEEYEEKLGKSIHLIFNQNIKKISKELKNNLVNGIVLKGYLKVFE